MRKAVALSAWILTGCSSEPEVLPPVGHVLLYVDTDAPLPPEPGVAIDPESPTPLFDRLSVAVFAPGELEPCAGCEREFDFHQGLAGGAFAVEPDGAEAGIVVRLRMYRRQGAVAGAPPPEATVEVVARLPDVPAEGAVSAHLLLATDSVGKPAGTLEMPIDAASGALESSRHGTWPGARRVACAGAPAPGEVCIPGGAAWMGNPLAVGDGISTATKQRIVVVSPFYLDDHETTVAELRATGLALPSGLKPWSGGSTGADLADYCTYTFAANETHDPLPVNCIGWELSRAVCNARGAELPTEAQLEYAAGGLRSATYVWGFDEPQCTDAVWGRGPGSVSPCSALLPPDTIGGPLPWTGRSTAPRERDFLELPSGRVFDLAGNVSEWALDVYQRQDEPCWSRPDTNVYVDPVCVEQGVEGAKRARRGGSWFGLASELRAAFRDAIADDVGRFEIGFRCARPAR